jgi:hypothetical protein
LEGKSDSKIFNEELQSIISKNESERNNDLIKWKNLSKSINCHPREEHLMPLMVIS